MVAAQALSAHPSPTGSAWQRGLAPCAARASPHSLTSPLPDP
jgi:hypothetical protein